MGTKYSAEEEEVVTMMIRSAYEFPEDYAGQLSSRRWKQRHLEGINFLLLF